MSAVSKKVTPASSAASTTAFVPAASTRRPKLLQPRPTTDTSSGPSVRMGIGLYFTAQPSRPGEDRHGLRVALAPVVHRGRVLRPRYAEAVRLVGRLRAAGNRRLPRVA